LTVSVADRPGSSIDQGNRYFGDSPLVLELPYDRYEHITVQTEAGETASVVVKGGDWAAMDKDVLILRVDPPKEEKAVDRFRKGFYGAYGRFWVALPIAFLLSGISTAYIDFYNSRQITDTYEGAVSSYYVSMGLWIVTGGLLGESLYRMSRYLNSSNANETKIAR
jgi:hypothetical protein